MFHACVAKVDDAPTKATIGLRASYNAHESLVLNEKFRFSHSEGVLTGYRINLSWRQILGSLFKLHNETVNIWSHLVGAVLFCFFAYQLHSFPDILKPPGSSTIVSSSEYSLHSYDSLQSLAGNLSQGNSTFEADLFDADLSSVLKASASCMLYSPLRSHICTELNDKAKSFVKQRISDWELKITDRRKTAGRSLERWPIYAFLASAVACLTCSVVFHLLYCKSQAAFNFMVRLDYSGVCCLIAGSYLPWIYYTFYCMPICQAVYLTIVAVLGLSTFGLSLFERFSTPEHVLAKTCTFVSFGLFAFIPWGHALVVFGPTSKTVESFLVPLMLEGAAYLTGASIFIKKFPENVIPGYVDRAGHSHNLWHLLVLVGALSHCFLCFQQFNFRQQQMCDA
jgi:adiponectin receptor